MTHRAAEGGGLEKLRRRARRMGINRGGSACAAWKRGKDASTGMRWGQERLGESWWHSIRLCRARPRQGTSGGGAAGVPAVREVEDE